MSDSSHLSPATQDLPPWLAAQLSELLAQRGHAWLLHGASGLGQYELALELARAWLCETRAPQAPSDTPACGHCPSCHMISSRTHPDLAMLMPETALLDKQWPLSEKAQSDLDDKKRKPSREIRVESMQNTVEFAQRTDARGRGKVVVVYPAEDMNHITANGLLKTLEEPQGNVKFILASQASHRLLPTIRSRCQPFAMRWPSPEQASAWLLAMAAQQGLSCSESDIHSALQMGAGRPLDAWQALQSGLAAAWQSLPRAVAAGKNSALESLSPAQALDALQKLCHDLMRQRAGAAPLFFDATSLPKAPSMRALGLWLKQLQQLAGHIGHTWKAELLLENLSAQAAKSLATAS